MVQKYLMVQHLQYDFIPIVGDGIGGVSRTIDINFGQKSNIQWMNET